MKIWSPQMTPLIQRAVDKIVDNAREAADKDEAVDVKT